METKKNRFNTVDDYLDSIDDPTKRKTLERVRAIIKATVPDAEEHISYRHTTIMVRWFISAHGKAIGRSIH